MKIQWLALLLLGLCGAAHAERDIVYSARYYTPPGSHRTSHSHIYRINPDGTGKTQLTFGLDEEEPRWSHDGKHILFLQVYAAPTKPAMLCEMDENGHRRHALRKDNGTWEQYAPVPGYALDDVDPGNGADLDNAVLVNTRTGLRVTLQVPADLSIIGPVGHLLPGLGRNLIYAAHYGNARVKSDYLFFKINPQTGALDRLTDGSTIIWSPDGLRFCLIPDVSIVPYEKRRVPFAAAFHKDATPYERTVGRFLMVETRPLYTRATAGGKMRQLTPRLSWATGADWRKVK